MYCCPCNVEEFVFPHRSPLTAWAGGMHHHCQHQPCHGQTPSSALKQHSQNQLFLPKKMSTSPGRLVHTCPWCAGWFGTTWHHSHTASNWWKLPEQTTSTKRKSWHTPRQHASLAQPPSHNTYASEHAHMPVTGKALHAQLHNTQLQLTPRPRPWRQQTCRPCWRCWGREAWPWPRTSEACSRRR